MMSCLVNAQDVLITKDSDTVECKIVSITDDLIYFEIKESDKTTKVPIEVLHKYLFKMEWREIGPLNSKTFEKNNVVFRKSFKGSVRKAGFHLERAGKYQIATPILSIGGVAFTIVGALGISDSTPENKAFIGAGVTILAAAVTSQILSAHHLYKAGLEFRFLPINEPILE